MSALYSTIGIVLRSFTYSENSAIVSIYTQLFGRQDYIVFGVQKGKNKKTALLQPLTLLNLEVYHSEKKELQKIKEMSIHIPFQSIPFQPYKNLITLFLADVLHHILREKEQNLPLYSFLENAITYLDLKESSISDFHIFFLVKLSRFIGIMPNFDLLDDNELFFDSKNGLFSTTKLNHPWCWNMQISTDFRLYLAQQNEFGLTVSLPMSGKRRSDLLEKLLEYFALHLEGFQIVKSLDIIREILA